MLKLIYIMLIEFKNNGRYINPDHIFSNSSICFLYREDCGLVKRRGPFTHSDLATNIGINGDSRRDLIANDYLLGRVGHHHEYNDIVSFWNIIHELLVPCLQELLDRALIDDGYYVSLPELGTIELEEVNEIVCNNMGVSNLEKASEVGAIDTIHLLPPDAKRAALERAGYEFGPSDWEEAMRNIGVSWRGTSEDVMRIADCIEES